MRGGLIKPPLFLSFSAGGMKAYDKGGRSFSFFIPEGRIHPNPPLQKEGTNGNTNHFPPFVKGDSGGFEPGKYRGWNSPLWLEMDDMLGGQRSMVEIVERTMCVCGQMRKIQLYIFPLRVSGHIVSFMFGVVSFG
jgi:hypothetical protein